MFVSRDEVNRRQYFLLAGPDGGPVDEEVFEFVGDPVQLEGQLERWDDLHVLRVAATGLRRVR